MIRTPNTSAAANMTRAVNAPSMWVRARPIFLVLLLAACKSVAIERQQEDVPAPALVEVVESAVDVQDLPAVAPLAGPLFRRLGTDDTGISHQNYLPPERQIEYLTMGAGLAAGDYNNDGLVDLYLVSESGPNKLYRNLGAWQFDDVTMEAGVDVQRDVVAGRWNERFTSGAVFADTDNDGDLDLYVTALAGAATLFQNNGDGTFADITEQAGVGHVGASTTATFGDYDRDGDLDIYVATHRPYQLTKYFPPGSSTVPEPELEYDMDEHGMFTPEPDRLYRNNGNGTFNDVAEEAGVLRHDFGLGAKFADLNEDGWPDLYVSNDFETPDRLYINQRDGTFVEDDPMMLQHSPMFSMGMDIGDINNDGHMDIVTSDMLSPNRMRRQTQSMDMGMGMDMDMGMDMGSMDMGSMEHPMEPMTDTASMEHSMESMGSMDSMEGDMMGMGMSGDGPPQVMRNALHIANGDGTFSDISSFAGTTATDWTWTMKFVDLDLDGFNDILVTNGFVHDMLNSDEQLLLGQMKQAGMNREMMEYERTRPPLLTPDILFRNRGDLTFENVATEWGFDDPSIGHGVALADIDNDGDLDTVVNNLNSPVGVYRNDADANRIKVALEGSASNRRGLGARLTLTTPDGEQVTEMSSSGGYMSGHEPIVVFGLGTQTRAERLLIEWPSGHVSEVRDLRANTSLTVKEPSGPGKIVEPREPTDKQFEQVAQTAGVTFHHAESHFDDYAVQPLIPEKMSQYGPGIAWGDANGDGDDDLAISGGLSQPGAVYENIGGGHFEPLDSAAAPAGYEQQAMLWWPDGTLLASLSAVESGADGPHPAVQVVSGALDVQGVRLPGSAGALAAADYDGDGQLDLFVGGRVAPGRWPEATSSGLFKGNSGTLLDVTQNAAPSLAEIGMVTGAVWSDVDGDRDPDLLLARDMGAPALLINDQGRLHDETASAGLSDLTGRWTGLATGDVDQDGDQDVVVANLGKNTRYRATVDEPYVVYAGDLAGDGGVDVIETEWEDGNIYPIRGATELGREMPFLGERFDSFLSFARATTAEVFGDQLAERAARYEVRTLAHTLLLNDGTGVFTAEELPLAAQLTSGYGVVMNDLDGDGHQDIYLVGNFNGPEPMHTGPYSGGVSVWLRGDGAGGFTGSPVNESGLSVPEDAKGLAAGDFDADGWVDLAVGLNSGPVKLFANRGVPGRAGVVLRLKGPAGNPNGIGAKVTLALPDGTVLTREVQAGSSFLSQSSSTQAFGVGESEGPVELTVTWPDGTSQTDTADPGSVVEIDHSDA